MTSTINLSPQDQIRILDGNTQQASVIAAEAQPGVLLPTKFVFFAAFDGTNNDLNNGPQTTNVAQLVFQVRRARNANHVAAYFAGPGTPGTLPRSSAEPTQVTRQVIATAKAAYEQFFELASRYPGVNQAGSISAAMTSFSRGGASAAIFSQLVWVNGLTDPNNSSRVLVAPGRVPISAGVIFDPVLTGVSGNMAFGPNTTNLVDILARDEYRNLFRAFDYRNYPNIRTILMFGAHSDIGGGYDNGIGALSLRAATDFFVRSGLSVGAIDRAREFNNQIVLHSEHDDLITGVLGGSYAEWATPADLNVNPRQFVGNPRQATAASLDGHPGLTFELFDGRIATITDPYYGREKVRIDSKTLYTERREITTYGLAGLTRFLDKVSIERNTNGPRGSQTIQAQILELGNVLDINVPAAAVTKLSVGGVDRVNSQGKLILGEDQHGVRIQGGTFDRVGEGVWRDVEKGILYRLQGGTLTDGKGSLLISGTLLTANGHTMIAIQNFLNGELGISLVDKQGVKISSVSSALGEGGATTVALKSDSVSDEERVYQVAADNLRGNLGGIVGDDVLSFSGGYIDITLPAGQSEVRFALIEQGDIDASASVTLTATLKDSDGNALASDSLTFNVEATVEPDAPQGAPVTTRDIFGDLELVDTNPTEPGVQGITDDIGNLVTTGNPAPDRADVLNDSIFNDAIYAGGGDDTVNASRGGDDFVDAGAGNDTVNAGAGNDLVLGGTGDDQLNGEAGDDRINGGAGSDVLRGDVYGQAGGNDVLEGGADDDIIYGNGLDDRIYGGDYVSIEDGIAQGNGPAAGGKGEFLEGLDGKDTIVGSGTADVLAGGDGEDVIIGGAGDDVFYGDATYDITGPAWSVTRTVVDNTYTTTLNQAVFVGEGTGDDRILGGAGDDWAFAGGGDDFVTGDAGADVAFGEAGSDTILGGDGTDVLSGDSSVASLAENLHGSDFLDGGAGDDQLYGNGGSDTLFGGDGEDTLTGDGSDVLSGGDDYLSGEAGNDQLFGGLGSDTVLGGEGDDTLVGDNGGTDASGSADFLDGGVGDDFLTGQGGDDTLIGGDGTDTLQGDDGADALDGGDGNDTLLGGAGEDFLAAGEGDDMIVGDKGGTDDSGDADFIDGGAGDMEPFYRDRKWKTCTTRSRPTGPLHGPEAGLRC